MKTYNLTIKDFVCTGPESNDGKDLNYDSSQHSKACAVTSDSYLNKSKWNILLDG